MSAAARPDLRVGEAFVDVQGPDVRSVLRDEPEAAVVVPLLLSAGYHVHVDIAEALDGHHDAVRSDVLGCSRDVMEILVRRVRDAGAVHGDQLVLATAGSRDPRARVEIDRAARLLGQLWGAPVRVGNIAAGGPTVADAVADIRDRVPAARVVVASYLLTPGTFWHRLHACGADAVSKPLLTADAPDPRLVRLVTRRFAEARAQLVDRALA